MLKKGMINETTMAKFSQLFYLGEQYMVALFPLSLLSHEFEIFHNTEF